MLLEYAMGTICAPGYANIFMAQFEAKQIYSYIHSFYFEDT